MNAGQSNPQTEAGQRFSKRVRLLRPSDFERVFNARNSASDAWIVLYGATSETGHPRIGLTVSRRVGGAVARNRWKRLLREAFRLTQSELPPLDLVCVVRGQAPPNLAQLRASLTGITRRIQSRIDRRAEGRAGRSS